MAVNNLINLAAIKALEQVEMLAERPARHTLAGNNPFEDLNNLLFKKIYRLTKPMVMVHKLVDLLHPHIADPTRISGLDISRKVGKWVCYINNQLKHANNVQVLTALCFFCFWSQIITSVFW